ncbi:hypothetical protein J885_4071, partial [Acinetobacter baumannii 44327_2]
IAPVRFASWMGGFLDVKKFNLGKILLRFYSIEAFFERNKKNPL